MKGFASVAWAVFLVTFDVRIDGVDLIPDLLGWAIAGVSLQGLARRNEWFGLAALAALPGIVVSLIDFTGEHVDLDQGVSGLAMFWLIVATCTGIARVWQGTPVAVTARSVRTWWVGISLAGLVVLASAASTGGAAPFVIVWALAGFCVLVWFALLLFRVNRPENAPVGR
jgi:hypothetical protein